MAAGDDLRSIYGENDITEHDSAAKVRNTSMVCGQNKLNAHVEADSSQYGKFAENDTNESPKQQFSSLRMTTHNIYKRSFTRENRASLGTGSFLIKNAVVGERMHGQVRELRPRQAPKEMRIKKAANMRRSHLIK